MHLRALGGGKSDDQLDSPSHLELGSRLRPALLLEVTKVHRTAGHHVHQGNLVKEKSKNHLVGLNHLLHQCKGDIISKDRNPRTPNHRVTVKSFPGKLALKVKQACQWQVATWDYFGLHLGSCLCFK